jgi:hypothetical protein
VANTPVDLTRFFFLLHQNNLLFSWSVHAAIRANHSGKKIVS